LRTSRATIEFEHFEHRVMEQAARVVERRAKAIVGHYQTDTAPFPIRPDATAIPAPNAADSAFHGSQRRCSIFRA